MNWPSFLLVLASLGACYVACFNAPNLEGVVVVLSEKPDDELIGARPHALNEVLRQTRIQAAPSRRQSQIPSLLS